MAEFDAGFKIVARQAGQGLCRMAGHICSEWEPAGDTVQATERLADRVFRARIGPDRSMVYFEAYTRWKAEAPWNMLAKSGLLSERERLPTICIAFILTPRGYVSKGGTLSLLVNGRTRQQLWYDVVRLWEQEPQDWWWQTPGLLPLLPLVRHGQPPERVISEAARGIKVGVTDSIARADLLSVLGFFGQLASPGLEVFQMITREDMLESKFYQDIFAEASKQGRQQTIVALICRQLRARFGPLPAGVRQRLKALTAGQLDKLAVRLLTAKSLRELELED